jgi:hypothetical protein
MKYLLLFLLLICTTAKAQFGFNGPEIGIYNPLIAVASSTPTPLISYNGVTNVVGGVMQMIDAQGNLNARALGNFPTVHSYTDANSVVYPNCWNISTAAGTVLSNSFPTAYIPTNSGTIAVKILTKSASASVQCTVAALYTAGGRNSYTLPARSTSSPYGQYLQVPVFTGTSQSGVYYSGNLATSFGTTVGNNYWLKNDNLFHWYVISWGSTTIDAAYDTNYASTLRTAPGAWGIDNNADYATSFKFLIGFAPGSENCNVEFNKWQYYNTQLTSNQIYTIVTTQ